MTGTVTETFDDNIYSDESREYDFLTTVALGLGVFHEGRRQEFSLVGNIYQDLYICHFGESNTSQDLALDYSRAFSQNVNFTLTDNFAHYPEPRDFEDQFGRTNIRRGYYTNTFATDTDFVLSRHFGFLLRYLNQVTFTMTDLMDDSYINGAGTDINYFIDTRNTIFLYYDFEHATYDTGEEIQTHTSGIGYMHYFTPQLSMRLQGGFGYDLSSEEGEHYSPDVLASLTDDIDENNTISLTFTMSHDISQYTSEIFQNWQISGEFTRQVLERLSFSLSAFYGQGEYLDSGNTTDLAGASVSTAYELTEHINVGCGYTFTYGSTSGRAIEDTDYFRNQVYLSFTASL